MRSNKFWTFFFLFFCGFAIKGQIIITDLKTNRNIKENQLMKEFLPKINLSKHYNSLKYQTFFVSVKNKKTDMSPTLLRNYVKDYLTGGSLKGIWYNLRSSNYIWFISEDIKKEQPSARNFGENKDVKLKRRKHLVFGIYIQKEYFDRTIIDRIIRNQEVTPLFKLPEGGLVFDMETVCRNNWFLY